jgi:PAS domain S-box-containing protein
MSMADEDAFHGADAMVGRMSAFDWSRTPLGAPRSWPASLRTLVGIMLGSKQPMFAVWGAGLTLLYNEPYRAILGHKDRDALGRSFLDVWSEARADLEPLVERAFAGESVHMDDITLIVDREGLDPEAHFAFSYTPVREGKRVAGFFCACSETTDVVIAARRQAFRLDLEEKLRTLDAAEAIMEAAVRALGHHLGVNRVGYAEMLDDDVRVALTSGYASGVGPLEGTYDLDHFGAKAAARLRRGRTVVIEDVRDEADTGPEAFDPIETRAYVTVPILRARRLRAALFVSQATPRRWAAEEIALIEGIAGRIGDAVQRVRAEQEASANAARFRTLTQAIPNQVWTATPQGDLDWANERTVTYCGTADFTKGEGSWLALVHPGDAERAAARWSAALSSREVYEVEFRIRRADGAYRWHLVRAIAEQDASGAVTRWIGTNTDIDDQKQAELALLEAKAVAEGANLAKSTFIANMSHELRTPLSAIIGYSEMMAEEIADGCDVADLAADMAKVEGNARHLLGLINDVLDLSKIESGKMEIYAEDFDVEAVVRDLAATVEGLIGKKGNRLALDLSRDVGSAHTDVTKLRQVLLNLLSNAAKFTEGGSITLAVSREPGPEATDLLRFCVRDSGIGMTPEQVAKLFQRFSQADSSTTRRFGGTGLGLSLTKAFADMLGGEVDVASVEGEGSAFTLLIPARYVEPTARPDRAPEEGAASPTAPGDLILVIDDDQDQLTLMSRFLHREGFNVQVAADGRTGLQLARDLHPRAILLDVMMPGVDGWSVLSKIKSDPNLAGTPVVMVTSVDQRSVAASLGAADYMLKPVRWDSFRKVMERFRTPAGGILVIEDEPDARTVVKAMLEEDGWVVTEAWDGRDGIRQATAHPPEVVLLDLNMPVMDGFDFLERFRQLPGCAEVPVVVLTARDLTREDRNRLRGANQILQKGDMSLAALVHRLTQLAASTKGDGDRRPA